MPRISLLAAALLAACSGSSGGGANKPPVTKLVTNDLDLLFVIDNSPGMQDKQDLLAANAPALVQALDAFPAGRPNLHVGVVSSTVGTGSDVDFGASCPKVAPNDDGLLVNQPRVLTGCTGPSDRYIVDVAHTGGRTTNYGSQTLEQTFGCIAILGDSGCGFEAPLEGMKRALDGSRPENAGFERPSAVLGILILTDEDDCSVKDPAFFSLDNVGTGSFRCVVEGYDCTPAISPTAPGTYTNCQPRTGSYLQDPDAYVQFLGTIADPSQVVLAEIAGDPETTIMTSTVPPPGAGVEIDPSCQRNDLSPPLAAAPGIRLDAVVTALGDHGLFQSACQPDYTASLQAFAARLGQTMGPCLDGPIATADRDATVPGLQLGCTAKTVDGTELLPCQMLDATTPDPAGPSPCIWYEPDSTCSAAPQLAAHLAFGTGQAYRVTCPQR